MGNNVDESLVAISEEEKYIKNFQAIYYQMNAKPESISRVFPKDVVIGLDDIRELNNTITEKFKSHYDDAGFLINVTVNLENRKTLDFNSWQKFDEHRWIENNSTNSITIVWEFNARLPKYQVPQKHRLMVKMSNGMRPEEMLNIIFTGKLEDIDEANNGVFPLVARVDYIDAMLGEEILEIVSKWRSGLRETEKSKSKLVLKLKKHKRLVAVSINYATVIVLIFCGIVYLNHYFLSLGAQTVGELSISHLSKLGYILFIIFISCLLTTKLFEVIAGSIYEQLKDFSDNHVFDITKGDTKAQEKIKRNEKQVKMSILLKSVGSILLDLIIGVITAIITK